MTMRTSTVLLSLLALTACIAPTSHIGTVSPEVVAAEQLKQQQLVIQSGIAEQQRLDDLAWPMLRAAAPLCGEWTAGRSGFTVLNAHAFSRDLQPAARSLGFTDTLQVTGVIAGSPAARSGIQVGDRLVTLADRPAPVGRTAVADFAARLTPSTAQARQPGFIGDPVPLTVQRLLVADTMVSMSVTVPRDTVCAYGSVAIKNSDLNAWADGKQIWVTTAMMRFAASDDELAVVVAHEIAHNAMRHLDAKNRNASAGLFLGLLADIALASQGINTGGDFTNTGAAAGAAAFSQDFEREADYVGMYILARAGRDVSKAPNFWRRMAQESPGSIKYASTHPTSAERFVRLEQFIVEIQRKVDAGQALVPERKAAPPG